MFHVLLRGVRSHRLQGWELAAGACPAHPSGPHKVPQELSPDCPQEASGTYSQWPSSHPPCPGGLDGHGAGARIWGGGIKQGGTRFVTTPDERGVSRVPSAGLQSALHLTQAGSGAAESAETVLITVPSLSLDEGALVCPSHLSIPPLLPWPPARHSPLPCSPSPAPFYPSAPLQTPDPSGQSSVSSAPVPPTSPPFPLCPAPHPGPQAGDSIQHPTRDHKQTASQVAGYE